MDRRDHWQWRQQRRQQQRTMRRDDAPPDGRDDTGGGGGDGVGLPDESPVELSSGGDSAIVG